MTRTGLGAVSSIYDATVDDLKGRRRAGFCNSLDDPICKRKQVRRDCQPQGLRGLKINR
jgi:hypothetical protein